MTYLNDDLLHFDVGEEIENCFQWLWDKSQRVLRIDITLFQRALAFHGNAGYVLSYK